MANRVALAAEASADWLCHLAPLLREPTFAVSLQWSSMCKYLLHHHSLGGLQDSPSRMNTRKVCSLRDSSQVSLQWEAEFTNSSEPGVFQAGPPLAVTLHARVEFNKAPSCKCVWVTDPRTIYYLMSCRRSSGSNLTYASLMFARDRDCAPPASHVPGDGAAMPTKMCLSSHQLSVADLGIILVTVLLL